MERCVEDKKDESFFWESRWRNPRLVKRRLQQEEQEEIVKVPAFYNSDLIEKFKLTLVGRMFHSDGRSVEAHLKHMPKQRENKFQFDFDNEDDLIRVLQRRPCHFNRWSFSLERWIPTIREDFPNTLGFWKKIETYQSVGNALGIYERADIEGDRVRVLVNGDIPLQFECKVGFDNGDIVKVTIKYENLHRYCFSYKRFSHEEGTCPNLNDEKREHNRIQRLQQKEMEERTTMEAFSIPQRQSCQNLARGPFKLESIGLSNWKEVREEKSTKREGALATLEKNYERDGHLDKTKDSASSSEWRVKDQNRERYGNYKENLRRRKEYSSGQNRVSPESQRTISDIAMRYGKNLTTEEWRPVNRERGTEGNRGHRTLTKAVEGDRNLKGGNELPTSSSRTERPVGIRQSQMQEISKQPLNPKTIETTQEDQKRKILPSDIPVSDAMEIFTVLEPVVNRGNSKTTETSREKTQKREKEGEEKELDRTINEYVNLAMDEETLENDNLLDEEVAEDEVENHASKNMVEEEPIEAISQLSPVCSKRRFLALATAVSESSLNGPSKGKIIEASSKD
ncbi:LOW QUALITY PROTEIN: hypothetical protein N665_0350s0003 [Sinapis alba]|nr:LOW QUALITY PROTEIN: hypothetical protein N665_0350s0003 [Sinapis alba]